MIKWSYKENLYAKNFPFEYTPFVGMLKQSLTFSIRNLVIGVAKCILQDLTNKWTVCRDGCV